MSPTLCEGRDIVLIVPADRYCGEGIYALNLHGIGIDLFRVTTMSGRRLHLFRDNDAYQEREVTEDQFDEAVCGFAVGRIEWFARPPAEVSEAGQ